MTIILRPPIIPSLEALPLIGALSVAKSIHSQLELNSKVRWPNDVVVYGSKVAGVIAEAQQEGNSIDFVLLGIGVNVNFESHKIRDEKVDAMTLMDLCGGAIKSSSLVCDILLELEELLALATSNRVQLLELLRSNDYSAGKTIRVVMDGRRMIQGVFVDYESASTVLVLSDDELVVVHTASAVLVEYMT